MIRCRAAMRRRQPTTNHLRSSESTRLSSQRSQIGQRASHTGSEPRKAPESSICVTFTALTAFRLLALVRVVIGVVCMVELVPVIGNDATASMRTRAHPKLHRTHQKTSSRFAIQLYLRLNSMMMLPQRRSTLNQAVDLSPRS